ncbi:MAG: hypothetical protein F6K22_39805, partial [Okeania sp. SIO2F4]|nr:hypothetical protein [Okeania sp. SIO2F4]
MTLQGLSHSGLWRVNGDGKYNVGIDHGKTYFKADTYRLREVYKVLQDHKNMVFIAGGVEAQLMVLLRKILDGRVDGGQAFVYLDPPYSSENEFTGYSSDGWGDADDSMLAGLCRLL